MPYLTREEEQQFAACLGEAVNPMSQLLAELRGLNVKSLADLEKIGYLIRECYQKLGEMLSAYLEALPDSAPLKKGSFLEAGERKILQLAPDTIIPFLAFCLQKAGASKEDCQKLFIQYEPSLYSFSSEFQYYTYLKIALTVLNQENQLVTDETVTTNSAFQPNTRVIRLKKLMAPLEEICLDKGLTISNNLRTSLNTLLALLKKEGDQHVEKNAFEQAAHHLDQLSSELSNLITELTKANLSKDSLTIHNQLITAFEDKFLTGDYLSNFFESKAIKEILQEIVEACHKTSLENKPQLYYENLLKSLLEPVETLLKDNRLSSELKSELEAFQKLYRNDIERLFTEGQFLGQIRDSLASVGDYLTNLTKTFINNPGEKEKFALQEGIAIARRTFEAKEIMAPLTKVIIDPQLAFSKDFKNAFNELHSVLTKEVESSLKSGKPKERISNEFGALISEIKIFTEVVGSKSTTQEEKKKTIRALKEHFEDQYSILSQEVVSALRKFIGSALTSMLLNTLEATAHFFKPTSKHEVKEFFEKGKTEVKKDSAQEPPSP